MGPSSPAKRPRRAPSHAHHTPLPAIVEEQGGNDDGAEASILPLISIVRAKDLTDNTLTQQTSPHEETPQRSGTMTSSTSLQSTASESVGHEVKEDQKDVRPRRLDASMAKLVSASPNTTDNYTVISESGADEL